MKRTHLVVILGLSMAGLAVLWWSLQPDREAPVASNPNLGANHATPGDKAGGARAPRPTLPGRDGVLAKPTENADSAARAADDSAPEQGGIGSDQDGDDSATAEREPVQPRSYVRSDGVLVRDYRKNRDRAAPTAPIRRPGTIGKIAPNTIVAVRNAVRPVVLTCLEDEDDRTFGDEPQLQTEVVVTISGGWLTAEEVNVQLKDVEKPTADSLRTCVTDGVAALTLDAQGHDDITAYTLTLPFRLRR